MPTEAGSPPADPRVLQARLQLVADSLMATVLFNPLAALVFLAALGVPGTPFGGIALWRPLLGVAAQTLCALAAFWLYRRYRQVSLGEVEQAERRMTAAQLLFSGVWGLQAFLYWAPASPYNHMFVVMVMAVAAFSVVFARSMHMPLLLVAVFTQNGLYFARLLTGEWPGDRIIAATIPFYMLYLLAMGRASHQHITNTIAARLANEDLASQLTRARDEAIKKRYEAETANASKTAFLANMSHELRTPLNAILGFSDVIARQTMGPAALDRYSEYARDIHASGVHLLSLINDLLDVAKIESGKMEIDVRPLDLRAAVETAGRLIGPRAAEKRQSLTIEIAPDVPPVAADERAFKQMLLNLLSNAVKFTPEGGHIQVHCARKGAGLEVCVRDDGPGIAADKIARVFEPFSQIDNRYDRQAGGTGLGLALVRGLARLHGGRAWIESELGAGCSAYIYVPSTMPLEKSPVSA